MGGTTLRVECYSGHTHAERPMAVYVNEKKHEVKNILKAWRGPDGMHYRLLLENDMEVEIMYDEAGNEWKEV